VRPGGKTHVGAVAVALAMALVARPAPAEDPAAGMLGQPAPSFRLADVRTGQMLSLEGFRGRFVVLHFGASW